MADTKSKKLWKKIELREKVISDYKNRSKNDAFIDVAGEDMKLGDTKTDELLDSVKSELQKTESALSERIDEFEVVDKAYLDMEKNPDPFYVDYNLLFANVDLQMSVSYANTMKVVFSGTNEADMMNNDIITKTAEYDFKYEMNMWLNEYIAGMDKFLHGVAVFHFDGWNKDTNAPVMFIPDVRYWRPDPKWWGHEKNFRWAGNYAWMTKQQMRDKGYKNVDEIKNTTEKTNKRNDDKQVAEAFDKSDDEAALFQVYHHMRTDNKGNKQLVTTNAECSVYLKGIELEYKIGDRPVFPFSLDYWKPQRDNPYGVRPYDLSGRKQNALSLLLNLGVKKAIRSSLGNHILVDKDAVVNKNDLKQLSEFPEIVLVDTKKWQISLDNTAREITRSQVPQDNFSMFNQLEVLNQVETAIGANQLGISPKGEQTAEEIRENAANANLRLGMINKVAFNFYVDLYMKRYMMYLYHLPEDAEKLIVISNDYGDRYMTFQFKHLKLSQDPHIDIRSKLEQQLKNRQHLANHIAIHTYLEQFSQTLKTNLAVRLSLRQLLREMQYSEEQIHDFVPETLEEMDAKSQLILISRNENLEPLAPTQLWEEHEVYLHVFKQCKETVAKRLAITERINMLKKRKEEERKQGMTTEKMEWDASNALNSVRNQTTANMINQWNESWGSSLNEIT